MVEFIGILPNLDKFDATSLTKELIDRLKEMGFQAYLPQHEAGLIGMAELGKPLCDWLSGAKFIMVLGGDGTLLAAARLTASCGKPLLGINLGHLGFLTEIEVSDLFEELPSFLAGDFVIEERIMLEANIIRADNSRERLIAMNDAVISKGPFARLIRIETYVNDSFVACYPADGLIVATPTGSTAYSLSAGGPVVNPNLDVLVVTPICPHTFYARPIVLSKDEVVKIRFFDGRETVLTLDGQEGYKLDPQDEVIVKRAPETVRLMRKPSWSFYEVLRRKLAEQSTDNW